MAGIKVIITGATGMVGEGVLFECLPNANVSEVLIINRRHYELSHPKLKELIVPDFFQLDQFADSIKGYNACFFCAGVSSVGYVSGSHTDSSEKGRLMWARVKGRTENDLMKLPFKSEYNFRPGVMLPFDGQRNWKSVYKFIGKIIKAVSPKSVLTMQQVGRAMINAATIGYPKPILEVADIRQLAEA